MFIIFQWDIGNGKKISMSGCKQMWKNNNILLSVDKCLYVGSLFIYLFILHFFGNFLWTFFRVKSFLHCIFIVACETIPVKLSVRNGQSIHVCVCVCVCAYACACVCVCVYVYRQILTSQYIMSWTHDGCHINMCFKLQGLCVKPDIHSSVNNKKVKKNKKTTRTVSLLQHV